MAPPARRRSRPSWPPRAALVGGMLVLCATWLFLWLGVAGLGRDLLRGPDPTVVVAAPAPPPELPGPLPFSGGAQAPALAGHGGRRAPRPRTVARGVVSMLLDHVHAGVPRGARVRVRPSPQVAALSANAAVPATGPSLRLTTVRHAAKPRTAPGVPVPDTTPPAVTCQTIDSGWHAGNVSISCSADDAGSGLTDPSDAHFSIATHVPDGSVDDQAQTDTRKLCDAAGNCAMAGAVGLAVDRRAPDVTCDAPDRSWQPANETVGCAATDGGSGLADQGDRRVTLRTSVAAGAEDPSASTDAERVCDAVGNCATAGPLTGLRIDRQPPRLRLAQAPDGADGWFVHAPAELDAVGDDDELARVTCVAGAGAARASGSKTATLKFSDDGTNDVTCTAVDEAGNATPASAAVKLDTGAPALSLTTDQRSYGVDDTVAVTCTAADSVSGIDAKDCPPRSEPASSFAPGSNTISASATDGAGNRATATTSFDVTVTVAGLSALTRRLVSDAQAAAALVADLDAVTAAPDPVAKDLAVRAFVADVRALPDQTVSAADTATLVRLAAGL